MMRLYGKKPVIERLKANPASIKKLYLQAKTDLSEVVREAKNSGIAFDAMDKAWFTKHGDELHTQGVIADVQEYVYAPFEEILDDCSAGISTPVFLDNLTDPQNLGSIIRTLACLGGFSIVIPAFESAEVNETVLRVASGGENYVKIAKVPNLVKAAGVCRDRDIKLVGTVVENGEDLSAAKLEFPLVIVIGSEGKGIRPGLRKCLDLGVTLPMRGAQLSFNAAVAAAIFAYDIARKKDM